MNFFVERLLKLYESVDNKYLEQFGFHIRDTTFINIVEYLHEPKDASSLAVTRILFGICMLLDIPDERGGSTMARRWGSIACHFPLIPFIRALPMPYMAVVYAGLWFGALGITLGYKFRISSVMFTVFYWYLFVIEKSLWNNHSYLFGLIGLLLCFTQANCKWSLDAYLEPLKEKDTVPYWNYFILKYQFFILYFMAGMKKGTSEWLTGYSVQNLGEHWVFAPFKIFLTVPQIDYLIIHWFIFVFDLTVAIWMMWARTRHIAIVFCTMFHLMNSRLFTIGMFPWVCLATMPLFYPFDWPKPLYAFIKNIYHSILDTVKKYSNKPKELCECRHKFRISVNFKTMDEHTNEDDFGDDEVFTYDDDDADSNVSSVKNQIDSKSHKNLREDEGISDENNKMSDYLTRQKENENVIPNEINSGNIKPKDSTAHVTTGCDVESKKKLTTYMIIIYMLTQAFLPYSHFITKGYNNWTDGLYGYSWDMMVHTWDTQSVVVKIVDNKNNEEYYIDPFTFTINDRWTRHGDMVYQYAHCLRDTIIDENKKINAPDISRNISVYIDVWCSMNGRFTQRMFDPKVDLISVSWSPFTKVSFLMPLLDEAIHWRSELDEITKKILEQNHNSSIVFFADFPDYDQEKFIPMELDNVTLTVLEGIVVYEPEVTSNSKGQSFRLTKEDIVYIQSGNFHKIINIGSNPAFYMYTYVNMSSAAGAEKTLTKKSKLPIITEIIARLGGIFEFAYNVGQNFIQMLFRCNGDC